MGFNNCPFDPTIGSMELKNELHFSLNDRVGNTEVGPRHVPLSLLGEFQRDVTDFLRGSIRDIDPSEAFVSVESGSLRLVVSGLAAASSLWTDLGHLRSPDALNLIDPKRATVIERWQANSRHNPNRSYRINDRTQTVAVAVSADTNFRKVEEVWVTVEKYLHGKVMNWGGKLKPNIHLELGDGSIVIVSASQDLLASEEQNRLYRNVLLHISAEENLMTGAIRNSLLLGFEAHQPVFDETEFQQMVKRGSAAWSDISSPTDWVEVLRAGRA
jgi:hypothetical protein